MQSRDFVHGGQPGDPEFEELVSFLNSVRIIPLTQGQVTLVDASDYNWLNRWKWYAHYSPHGRTFYALRNIPEKGKGKQRTLRMARAILGAKPSEIVDHVNHNTLDNRRANLRIVTASQNQQNQRLLSAHNTSGFRGVSWHQVTRKWGASIKINRKQMHLGLFTSPQEGAAAYDRAAREWHQGFTPLNFP